MSKSKTYRVIESSPGLQRRKEYFFQRLRELIQKGKYSGEKAKKAFGYLVSEANQRAKREKIKLAKTDRKKAIGELIDEFEGLFL